LTTRENFRGICRSGRLLAVSLGVVFLLVIPAVVPTALSESSNFRPSNGVPAAWTRYAQLVQLRFKERLAADDPVAYRFHLFLENRVVSEDAPPEALVVKVWIARDGEIQQVVFAPLKDQQANDDLHALLIGGNVGEPPPPDMLQPLQLRLALSMPS
jgi:hypothetical protein